MVWRHGKPIFLEARLSATNPCFLEKKGVFRKVWKPLEIVVRFFCAVFCLTGAVRGVWAGPLTFSNTNLISLQETNNPTRGEPYPSTNLVSGLAGQTVQKVTVTVQGFTDSFPSDEWLLLVGPQGQQAILMASAGGQNKYSVANLSLTFDDDASDLLPIFTSLTSGTFQPTNGTFAVSGKTNLPFDFPPPAPPGNSNAPSALSVFKNTDPDGTWSLFALSAGDGDTGAISNGWTLNLTMAAPLRISHSGSNVVVSWPASATNCTLQSSANVSGNTWSNIAIAPTMVGSQFNVTNPVSSGSAFYQLIRN